MKKNFKKALAKTLSGLLVFGLVATAMPALNADAAAKPKLSAKKVSVNVKKTKKITVKGKKIKKTTWSVTKGKKNISLSAKKKTSVKIKGKKKGSATVTAKVKVGKKTTKLTCKVTVKKATTPNNSTTVTSPKPSAAASVAPGTSAAPSVAPSIAPSKSPRPSRTPYDPVYVPQGNVHEVALTAENESAITLGKDDLHADLKFNADGSYRYCATEQYNSGVAFYVKSEDQVTDVSDFDYVVAEIEFSNSDKEGCGAVEASMKLWNTHSGWYSGKCEVYEGANFAGEGKERVRTYKVPLGDMVKKGIDLSGVDSVAVVLHNGKGQYGIVKSIKFLKNEGDEYVSKTVAKNAVITAPRSAKKVLEGNTLQLTASVLNKNNEAISGKEVTWTSSDTSVATVSDKGLVTAVKSGKTTITADVKDTDLKPTYEIQVYNNDPVALKLAVNGGFETLTVDEGLNGVYLNADLINANDDAIATAPSNANISIVSGAAIASVTYDADMALNKLTVSGKGTVVLKLESNDGFDPVELTLNFVEGIRVPLREMSMCYNTSDMAPEFEKDNKRGTASITVNGYGMGISCVADLGDLTVADIKGVQCKIVTDDNEHNELQLFASRSGYDQVPGCVLDSDSDFANAFPIANNVQFTQGGIAKFALNDLSIPPASSEEGTTLDPLPTDGNTFAFAIGVNEMTSGTMTLSDVILLTE